MSLRQDQSPRKTVEAIIKSRESGKTLRAIAEHYGLSQSSISRIVKKIGERRRLERLVNA